LSREYILKGLGVETFLVGSQDLEARQYLVLQSLKEAYAELSCNRLYPTLSALVELHTALENIIQKKNDIRSHFPQNLKGVDVEQRMLVYEQTEGATGIDLERTTTLIEWAMPKLKKALDEGVQIFNFVDQHIVIEQVGILPMYREEGYWFVPDRRSSVMYLLRYEVSLFTSTTERFRTLKTRCLESIEESTVRRSPESIKLDLIEKYHDLPNPATFVCETDIEFPYGETMLPVAKRKLMTRVFS
jgi:hypothetical protein